MIELLVAFISGGALTALIKGLFDVIKIRQSQKKLFPDAFKKMNEIYGLMNKLKSEINCERVLIIKAKNGGGLPKPGTPLFVSVLYEVYDSDFVSSAEWWQSRQVDESYIGMLMRVEEEEQIAVVTNELKSGILKDLYEAQEVEGSMVSKIVEKDNRYYIVSCNFKDKNKMNLAAKVHLSNYTQKLKELI